MAKAEISTINPFEIAYEGEQKRNLSFVNFKEFLGSPKEAQGILRTLMLMHIIAPEFPNTISTNFKVEKKTLIDELYRFYGKKIPTIVSQKELVETKHQLDDTSSINTQIDYANAQSGGLDSAYRTARLMAAGKSLIGVHLRNLNPKANYLEHRASVIQAEEWGIPLKTLVMKNGSKNSGYKSMMTRDLLLGMAVLTSSYGNGIKEVQIEGDFVVDKKGSEFSEYKGTWDMFNLELKKSGIEIQIKGVDAGDVETIRELISLENKLGINILDLIQNCFSAEFQKNYIVKKWQRVTPNIASASSEHWCGSCLKCRRMTLGRLYYFDPKFNDVPKSEVKYFVEDTYKWMKDYPQHQDLVSAGFKSHLDTLTSRR